MRQRWKRCRSTGGGRAGPFWKKNKKLTKRKYSGFELWKECLLGNKEAWEEMRAYNIKDVLSLEELYLKLQPWDSSFNNNLYRDSDIIACNCGANDFTSKGYAYTATGKFKRYVCKSCGAETRDRINHFTKEKKESLRVKAT